MNVHNLTVKVGTQINLRNPHKSFIPDALCRPRLALNLLFFPCKYPGFLFYITSRITPVHLSPALGLLTDELDK